MHSAIWKSQLPRGIWERTQRVKDRWKAVGARSERSNGPEAPSARRSVTLQVTDFVSREERGKFGLGAHSTGMGKPAAAARRACSNLRNSNWPPGGPRNRRATEQQDTFKVQHSGNLAHAVIIRDDIIEAERIEKLALVPVEPARSVARRTSAPPFS
jgi:hypothetical protein